MHATKKGNAFLIYLLSVLDVESPRHETPSQYKEFKDVFDKKNVNTLLKHHSYDCTINLEEGAQLPFRPIYNLSQNKLATICEYIEENLEKGFI